MMKFTVVRGKKIPVRLPLPKQTGGVHRDERKYSRQRDRKGIINRWKKGEE